MAAAAATSSLARAVSKVDTAFPPRWRHLGYSYLFNSKVKFAGTAGVRIHELTSDKAVVKIANRIKVQNHIGGVHACAMALASETATGVLVGMNVPDDRIMVIKRMQIEYKRRAKGALTAVATLSSEQVEAIRTTEKGDTIVPVTVTDEEGKEPISCEMQWAWVPRHRGPKPAAAAHHGKEGGESGSHNRGHHQPH